MAAIFGEGKIFGKLERLHSLDTLWVENFDEIALSHTVQEIEANLCFAIFGKNSKIQNGRHLWGGENFLKTGKYPVGRKFRKFFKNWQQYNAQTPVGRIALSRTVKEIEGNLCFAQSSYTLWVENFDEIALSRTVKETEANLCFAKTKIQKFKMAAILGRGKFFENWKDCIP